MWLNRKPRGELTRLVQASGLSKSLFCFWMRGDVVPRMKAMAKVQAVTGITMVRWVQWLGQRPAEEE